MKTNTFLTKKKSLFVFFSLLASFCYASSVSSASISSFSVSSDTVNIDLTPSTTSSASATGSHTATITTDCSSGYKVYVSMTSDAADNKLHLNGDNSNTTVGTNALGPTAGSFDTMATLSGNSWGVKVGSGSASSNFAAVPTYSSISTTNQSTNPTALITGSDTASGTSYTITYGANVSSALTPGEYTGNVLYTAIMDQGCYTAEVTATKASDSASQAALSAVSGSGTYTIGSEVTLGYTLNTGYHFTGWTVKDANNNNITVTNNKFTMPSTNVTATASGALNTTTINYSAGTGATGTPSKTSETATYGTNVTMPTVGTMAKTNYKFIGWGLTDGTTTPTWTAGQTGIDPTTIKSDLGLTNGGSITVYAVWEQLESMQAFSCSSLANTGDSTLLYDTRDGKTYTVKKLADGKCWMTQNLALIDTTISDADSNLPAGTTFTVPAHRTGWGDSYNGNSATSTRVFDTTQDADSAKAIDATNGKWGVLYNYATASAGTSWYGGGVSSGNLTQDICPKGWRLPTGKSSGEFTALDKAYGGTGLGRASANTYFNFTGSDMSFVLPGYYYYGSHDYAGTGGYYWSSSQDNSNNASIFSLSSADSGVYPLGSMSKYRGFSVRCVAKSDSEKTISDLYYMQDINSTIIGNTPQGASATLTDKRDGKTYTVKKLLDGNIWMTQNLALIDTTITSEDSNIPAGTTFTVPAHSTGWADENDDGVSPKVFDTTQDTDSTNATNAINGKWGVLYNYATAAAATSWYEGDLLSGWMVSDICPKGWRLPIGGTASYSGEYAALDIAYGGTGHMRSNANTYSNFVGSDMSFVLSGGYDDGSYFRAGTRGYYWTTSRLFTSYGFEIISEDSFIAPDGGTGDIAPGQAIRCIAENRNLSNVAYMQDMTPGIVERTPVGTSATLTDIRDRKTYTVKKLADGNIWMTQNLAIMNKTISSADSNLPSGTSFTLPASTTGWGSSSESAQVARLHNDSTYGVVYNYYAATGGGAWYGDGKSDGTIITQDICPKGWRLPTGGAVNASTGNGEFQTLYNYYNSNALMRTDASGPQFTLAGYYDGGSRSLTGSYGRYWSSTINDSSDAYRLYLNTSSVGPQGVSSKYDGISIRCVAK